MWTSNPRSASSVNSPQLMADPIDPRLARRRRQVQEASARRRLRWTIMLLTLAILAGLVVAIFRSSWFSIDNITVEGANRSPVREMLAEVGVEEGVSIVSIRSRRAEDRLLEDPWVAEAEVRVVWPRSVQVTVVEHVPVARVTAGPTWLVSSGRGAVLAEGTGIVDAVIDIDVGLLDPGMEITNPAVLGALEFVAALPDELHPGTIVSGDAAELEATVGGYEVVLGAPKEMAQKAVTLAAVLDQGIEQGAVISLISPLRPAVSDPQSVVESSPEGTTTTTASG